jgi:hypothetical protein
VLILLVNVAVLTITQLINFSNNVDGILKISLTIYEYLFILPDILSLFTV